MKGNILNVQRFCTRDGPGIRTTVFLMGCPLRCLWCHNPEAQELRPSLMYDPSLCTHCLRCTAVCPTGCHREEAGGHRFDRRDCIACGACTSPLCNALTLAGEEADSEEILREVLRDRPYYEKSGGGLTLSGGEPLMQGDFAYALLSGAREQGIHTCVETCGYCGEATLLSVAPLTDLFLFDLKETDPQRHEAYTGAPLAPILGNLSLLDRLGRSVVLRCPVIPTLNDREEHWRAVAALASVYSCVREIVVEPYHTLGVGKYPRLGREYDPSLAKLTEPTRERMEEILTVLREEAPCEVSIAQ